MSLLQYHRFQQRLANSLPTYNSQECDADNTSAVNQFDGQAGTAAAHGKDLME